MDGNKDHCLDAIRQELQCRAEVSLTTYEWLPDLPIPWAKLSYEHTCVDFDVSDYKFCYELRIFLIANLCALSGD